MELTRSPEVTLDFAGPRRRHGMARPALRSKKIVGYSEALKDRYDNSQRRFEARVPHRAPPDGSHGSTMATARGAKKPPYLVAVPVLLLLACVISIASIFQVLQAVDTSNPVSAALTHFRRSLEADALTTAASIRSGIVQRALEPHIQPQDPPSWPVEEPIPNPPKANGNSTFSACLLV